MTFHSILFLKPEDERKAETAVEPGFFIDLNLDQIVDAITLSKQEYDLKAYFYTGLTDDDAIHYRHEVIQDLENKVLFEIVQSFASKMIEMRRHLKQVEKLYYPLQKQRWFLDAVDVYCEMVLELAERLATAELKSRGFLGLRDYVSAYARSERFTSLLAETKNLLANLDAIHYSVILKDNSVKVLKYEGEIDYSADVEETFQKFKLGAVKDYRVENTERADMNHVEAHILDFVALLFPEIFQNLKSFCIRNAGYLDETLRVFDREVQFYVAYLDFIATIKRAGLRFCYPHIAVTDKSIYSSESFDLALADKLVHQQSSVISNDFYLDAQERIIIVSGPNQGGKTTFARMFGQLHYLASLGCQVPGREARLFLYDRLFTHFEKEEDLDNLRGKLEDDLIRIHAILEQATPNSIIIMNEIFTSTTLNDAIYLSRKVMDEIIELDLLCVCVTFMDELATISEKTVSMVSTVVPDNPALRTFRIIRRPPDGLAYAISIAEKYRLTYGHLKERMRS